MTHQSDTRLDWRTVSSVAAVTGGTLWAAISVFPVAGALVCVVLMASGLAFCIRGSRRRSWGIGLLLAPLTGAVPLVIFMLFGMPMSGVF
jgi:hypothetical protein